MSIEKWDAWSAVYQRREHRYIAEGNGWFFSITPSDFIRRWNVNVLCYFPTQNVTGGFCKALIIKFLELNFEGQILRRGTEWGRKNDKKRQFLPHKKQRMITNENTIFRFLSFLHSLTWILSFVVPFSWWSFFDRHSCFLIYFLYLKSL